MRWREDGGKVAVDPYHNGADLLACSIFYDDRTARLAFTGQQQAIQADFKLGRCRRCRGVARHNRGRQRDVACLVGEGDVEAFAIFLCRAQGRGQRAISSHGAGTDLHTRRVFNRDGAACLAFAGQGQAISADAKLRWRRRSRGVARHNRGGHRDVARLVGEGDVEGFAIFLRGIEDRAKRAIKAHHARTNGHAGRVFHGDDAARFTFTGQQQAIKADRQAGWRCRCRGVARFHADGRRRKLQAIGQGDTKGFTVLLRSVEGDGKVAVHTHSARTDHRARSVFDRHRQPCFALATQGQAIQAHHQVGWGLRCQGAPHNHSADRGLVTRRILELNIQGLAIALSRVKHDCKAAIHPDKPCTDDCPVKTFNGHGGARLAFTRQHQTAKADCQVGRSIRIGGVTGSDRGGQRHVAGLVGQGDVKQLAIFLRRCEYRTKRAIFTHGASTHLHTRSVFNDNRAARLTFTGQRQAINTDFKLGRRRRCGGITRYNRSAHGHVARLVGEGNVEALAIFLCRSQDRDKRAIQPNDAGADLHTCGVFHDDGAARFAFTGQRQTIEADFKLGRRRWSRGITRCHNARQGHVARLVGQSDVEDFAIFLRRIERCG